MFGVQDPQNPELISSSFLEKLYTRDNHQRNESEDWPEKEPVYIL